MSTRQNCENSKCLVIISLFVVLLLTGSMAKASVCRVDINGLSFGIDEQTGSIVFISYPATGTILEALSKSAGLLDVAYPIEQFTPMRLASRFSQAQLIREPNGVTIIYNRLGPSRPNFNLPAGEVVAKVTIKSAPDGKSVILSCKIENHSVASIPQIMFPDLWGFKPFDGAVKTELRMTGGVEKPFLSPLINSEAMPAQCLFYVERGWRAYPSLGYTGMNILRWIDFGSLKGGLSIFQRKWGTDDVPVLRTQRTEADLISMRMLWEHKVTIEPNQSWESGEFWLTPHRGGWAKGIEVFRDYVEQVNPPRELPKHVRDGLGFQTIWMIQSLEKDPNEAAFRFADIPRVAKDASEHGIDELQIWGWCNYATLPITVRSELGTKEELVDGILKARQIGVNIGLYNSIQVVLNKYAERYGGTPGTESWTFHPEFIPNKNPYYSKNFECSLISNENKVWQKDVETALLDMVDSGMPSISWDVFDSKVNSKGGTELVALIGRVREHARTKYPQSTFAAETSYSAGSFEREGGVVDYTWCWQGYVEAGPLMNVLRSPRPNCVIEDSPLVVKKAFCDGLYLTLFPKKPDKPNGTALMGDLPPLSRAVKEMVALRKQFLPYFTEGWVLGNSVLCEAVPVFVSAHQLDGKLLIICLNDTQVMQIPKITCDFALWLPEAQKYTVNSYNTVGKLLETSIWTGSKQWVDNKSRLEPLELKFFEIYPTE